MSWKVDVDALYEQRSTLPTGATTSRSKSHSTSLHQTQGGSIDIFKISTHQQIREWASVIKTMEDALILYQHKPGTLATQHWEYLHKRTGGSIASLHALIRQAAITAVHTGRETIGPGRTDRSRRLRGWSVRHSYVRPVP